MHWLFGNLAESPAVGGSGLDAADAENEYWGRQPRSLELVERISKIENHVQGLQASVDLLLQREMK